MSTPPALTQKQRLDRANDARRRGDKEAEAAWVASFQASASGPPAKGNAELSKMIDDARREARSRIEKATRRVEVAKRRLATAKAQKKAAVMASETPHLDRFNALSGALASHYYKEHGKAIRAEQIHHVEAARKARTASPREKEVRESVLNPPNPIRKR